MATYTYEVSIPSECTVIGDSVQVTNSGTLVFEVTAPIGTAPLGMRAERIISIPGGHELGCWPNHNEAVAVHPADTAEAMREASKRGVPTDFDSQGRAVFTSHDHFCKYLKAFDLVDRSGYR